MEPKPLHIIDSNRPQRHAITNWLDRTGRCAKHRGSTITRDMGFKRGAPGIGSKYSARDLASIDASGLRKMRPLRISGRPLQPESAPAKPAQSGHEDVKLIAPA
jgi:hypothetical protein